MRRPFAATLALCTVVAAAVGGVYWTQRGSDVNVEVTLGPALDSVVGAREGTAIVFDGQALRAEGCEVRARGAATPIVDGAFRLEVPAPPRLGPDVVWIEVWCDDTRAAVLARRIDVRPTVEDAPQTVARLRLATPTVIDRIEAQALTLVNARLAEAIRDEIDGEEVVRFEVPLGRWANAAQRWAEARLDEEAAARVNALVPDGVQDATVAVAWGEGTTARLSNLQLEVDGTEVVATFDAAVAVDVAVTADPPVRRGGDGWDPDPLEVDLVRIGARFDLADWPRVQIRDVDLLGDLCSRPDERFWRRACDRVAPELAALVERPVERALNERAAAWAAEFDLSEWLMGSVLTFGLGGELQDRLRAAAADAELTVELEAFDDATIALVATVSPQWLGTHATLAAPSGPPTDVVELSIALPLVNRALDNLFDRPLGEVASALADVVETVDPERAAAIRSAGDEIAGRGRAATAAWSEALALANLAVDDQAVLRPSLGIASDALALTLYDARVFRGVERDDVSLSVSASLPVRFVVSPAPADDAVPVFRLQPDTLALLDTFALEAVGPDSTTRDDARRFAAFFRQELRRNFVEGTDPPLVDLRGLADLDAVLPTVPRVGALGPVAISLSAVAADQAAGGLVIAGDVAVHPSVLEQETP